MCASIATPFEWQTLSGRASQFSKSPKLNKTMAVWIAQFASPASRRVSTPKILAIGFVVTLALQHKWQIPIQKLSHSVGTILTLIVFAELGYRTQPLIEKFAKNRRGDNGYAIAIASILSAVMILFTVTVVSIASFPQFPKWPALIPLASYTFFIGFMIRGRFFRTWLDYMTQGPESEDSDLIAKRVLTKTQV